MTPDELLVRYPRETLRWLRGRLGLTQLAFGLHIGVSANTVVRWEAGRHGIGPTHRACIVPLLAPYLHTAAGRAWLRTLGAET